MPATFEQDDAIQTINWALADQAMLSGINFLTGILLARYLGITEFGVSG